MTDLKFEMKHKLPCCGINFSDIKKNSSFALNFSESQQIAALSNEIVSLLQDLTQGLKIMNLSSNHIYLTT